MDSIDTSHHLGDYYPSESAAKTAGDEEAVGRARKAFMRARSARRSAKAKRRVLGKRRSRVTFSASTGARKQ